MQSGDGIETEKQEIVKHETYFEEGTERSDEVDEVSEQG